jgi:phage shock protein B
MDDLTPVLVCAVLFIGLPWVILHYITKWKQAPRITEEDEKLLDEMQLLARRLEDRVMTVERIIAVDNPDWKPGLGTTQSSYLSDRQSDRTIDRNSDRRN